MNHAAAVEQFLTGVVNLNPDRLAQLDTHVAALVGALADDKVIGPMVREHLPQGSWAHETIIRPVGDRDEFDADLEVENAETDTSAATSDKANESESPQA